MLGMDSDGQKCKNSGRLGHCSNDRREDGGLDEGGSSRGGEKWLNSGRILR